MSDRTKIGDTTLGYLSEYPDAPNLTIARLMRKDHPKVFTSVEQARASVRYYRGRMGNSNRGKMALHDFVLPKPTADNPMSLPESDAREWVPYAIGPNYKCVLVLADLHVPYHDVAAITTAIEYAKQYPVDCILFNGDLMDCHRLSKYEKDPESREISVELEKTRQVLFAIANQFPGAKIVVKEGNHDRRWQSYMRNKAPELIGINEFRLDVLLRLMDLKADWVDEKRRIKCGHLWILHGDEYIGGGGGVNPARSMFLKAKDCVLSAHNHQTTAHSEPTISDKVIACWSMGCLSELHPQYMPLNKWNLGFTIIERPDAEQFTIHNKRILKGEVY